MGRDRTTRAPRHFKYDSVPNKSICQIENCQHVVSGDHGGNLERHLQRRHKEVYDSILADKASSTKRVVSEEVEVCPVAKPRQVDIQSMFQPISPKALLGINVQYAKNRKVILQPLAMKELFDRHTAEHLTSQVKSTLSRYDLSVAQVSPGLPSRHGKIRDLSRFDAAFFSTHPKQAELLDPQIRLLLETSYEAIVDAGYDPESLRGRNIGVFVGVSASETSDAVKANVEWAEAYGLLACCHAMFANRISYALELHGNYKCPSLLTMWRLVRFLGELVKIIPNSY
ncbi:hypothetical protein HPB50_009634 [Hyalomma asiaticum]|uniref:Uncharacterized protein n=1 Tax=Hyalomma asiaticum TaxID=266040 RepID=A0ACB7T717_HYAAI|nr:hypothetical protein HPB50_009634 [Hyalomma asiaticum]